MIFQDDSHKVFFFLFLVESEQETMPTDKSKSQSGDCNCLKRTPRPKSEQLQRHYNRVSLGRNQQSNSYGHFAVQEKESGLKSFKPSEVFNRAVTGSVGLLGIFAACQIHHFLIYLCHFVLHRNNPSQAKESTVYCNSDSNS